MKLTFEQKKELLELEYNLHMKEFEKEKELIVLEHNFKLEELRIKSAEVRKSQERKYRN